MRAITLCLFSLLILLNVACTSTTKDSQNTDNTTVEASAEQPAPIYQKVDVATFKQKLSEATDPQVIDVRTPREVQNGTIENAVNINFYDNDFKDQIAELDRNKPVFVYCKAGGRSGQALKAFENLGFKEVYDLAGGYTAWSEE